MKNKGFTVIEFAISFCLIAAVSLLLFELVISLKNIYFNGNIKSTLLTKQGIMLQRINDDYDSNYLRSVTSCGLSCLSFTYQTPLNTQKTTTLEIDPYNKTITYDDYTMKIETGNEFGNINVTNYYNDKISNDSINNSILTIEIPIYNTLLNENFDIKINLPYRSSYTSVNTNLNISNTTILLDDINIPITTIPEREGYYAEVLSHDVTTNKETFTNIEEFKKTESENKKSSLFALDLFKGKYNNKVNFDVFDFVLMYPDYSKFQFNNWYQSSNFLSKEIENYYAIEILWNNKWNDKGHFIGLNKVTEDNECGFVDTNDEINSNCYTTIGAKKLINNGFTFKYDGDDKTAYTMKLYVRCDEYIDKYALSNIIK